MEITTLQAKPVQVKAVKWDGTEESLQLIEQFVPGDELTIRRYANTMFALDVWNYLEKQYIHCPLGHWIIRGLKGEFYPCEEEALFMKYDIVDDK